MRKINIDFTRYEEDGYYVDIIGTDECWEAWLQHSDLGVSELMFGVSRPTQTRESFLQLVLCGLDESKSIYAERNGLYSPDAENNGCFFADIRTGRLYRAIDEYAGNIECVQVSPVNTNGGTDLFTFDELARMGVNPGVLVASMKDNMK